MRGGDVRVSVAVVFSSVFYNFRLAWREFSNERELEVKELKLEEKKRNISKRRPLLYFLYSLSLYDFLCLLGSAKAPFKSLKLSLTFIYIYTFLVVAISVFCVF